MRATGWFGTLDQVTYYLATVGADRDDHGRFQIWHGGITAFLGDTRDNAECVIDGSACYAVQGVRRGLAAGLASTSYGMAVTVF